MAVKSREGEKSEISDTPEPEKVKSETPDSSGSLQNMPDKVVETKEREKKAAPVFLSPEKAERQSPFWCEAHGFCHGERLSDQLSDCWRETEGLTARVQTGPTQTLLGKSATDGTAVYIRGLEA